MMDTNPQDNRAAASEKVPSFERFFEQEHLLTDRILDCASGQRTSHLTSPSFSTWNKRLFHIQPPDSALPGGN